jgi:predicted amidohydrolase
MVSGEMEQQASVVKVAAVQFDPKLGEVAGNREKLAELINQAFDQQAKLVVTPEMGNCGYIFESKEEAARYAEPVPGGATVALLEELAAKRDGYIVSGMMEQDGDKLYNVAVLVGPDGYIGKYRKTHLWDVDKSLYEPGDQGFPVFDLPFGRIGMSICYDQWFPEVSRIYAMQGVDIICNPTNWVVIPGMASPENPAWALIAMTQAHTNGVYMVCADRVGEERGTTFGGTSCVLGLPGFVAGPLDGESEGVLVSDLDIAAGRVRMLSAVNHLHNDRRTDLYDECLGYKK